MRGYIITRYIFREALGPFIVGAFFFTFVILIIGPLPVTIRLILERGVAFVQGMELLMYLMPCYLAITLPMGVLMGSIMAYGRISGDSEVVAMKALGISLTGIYRPIAIFGISFFVIMTLFNDVIMPESNYRYRALWIYTLNSQPSVAVEKYRFVKPPGGTRAISATGMSGRSLSNVTIFDNESSANSVLITAASGTWSNNQANSRIISLMLRNGLIQETDRDDPMRSTYTPFTHIVVNINRSINDTIGFHGRGDLEVPSWEIMKRIITGKKSNAPRDEMKEHMIHLNNRYAIPFACLILALLGGPLGTISRRSGKGVGFGISVVVVFVYYAFLIGGEMLGRTTQLPAWFTVWLPNIALGAAAVFFYQRLFIAEGK
ncbi:MAG: LptF/LptG family permease [Spirochaetota bacterium]